MPISQSAGMTFGLLSLVIGFLSGLTASLAGAQPRVQLGPRPYYLVEKMEEGTLKTALQACADNEFTKTNFSIAHRGAPLQFPEHTKEAYEAGARMGAGIMECDVTFTQDLELVCRHSQCDLHTTTDIPMSPQSRSASWRPDRHNTPAANRLQKAHCRSDKWRGAGLRFGWVHCGGARWS